MDSLAPTHQKWFQVTEPSTGVFAIREPLADEDVLSYLVVGDDDALLIDTGMGVGSMRQVVESLTDLPLTVVNSHDHWDHIGNNAEFDDIAIHRDVAEMLAMDDQTDYLLAACQPDRLRGPLPPGVTLADLSIPPSRATRLLVGGEQFELGGRTVETLNAPGHAEGLLVFLDRANGVLISTDAAYPAALYAQLDGSDMDKYRRTMSILAELAPELHYVHPSHSADSMPPAMLIAMRDALEEVGHGRKPEAIDGDAARHDYHGFSVLVPAPASKD